MGILLVMLVMFGLLVVMPWLNLRAAAAFGRHDRRHAEAEAQFRTWLQSPAAAQLALSSAAAEPALKTENIVKSDDNGAGFYSLTWYLRNAEGHYVMLLSTEEGKPFVKLLEDRYARVVLKTRYRPPA
jgi:hypothetical protein